MNGIKDFVGCDSRSSAHRVNLHRYVPGAPSRKPCFTFYEDDLLFCDSCRAFWLERQGARDLTTLERAMECAQHTSIAPPERESGLGRVKIKGTPPKVRVLGGRFGANLVDVVRELLPTF